MAVKFYYLYDIYQPKQKLIQTSFHGVTHRGWRHMAHGLGEQKQHNGRKVGKGLASVKCITDRLHIRICQLKCCL